MPYGEKFEDALLYASRVHRDQVRKGTSTPYITHLLAVASIVGENGGTEDEVVAALLHDAPEDQGGEARLRDIRAQFGDGGRGDSRRLHGHLRGPRNHRGASARSATWPTSQTLQTPYASSPPRTSCTTPAPCSPTTGYSAKASGRGSTARKQARSGTTAPS